MTRRDPPATARGSVGAQFELARLPSHDSGVAEITDDKRFVDLGGLMVEGGYPLNISDMFGNTLGTRPAWTGGDLGAFRRVTVDLTPFA